MPFTKIFCSLTDVHCLIPDKALKNMVAIKATIFFFLKQRIGVNVLAFSEITSDNQ